MNEIAFVYASDGSFRGYTILKGNKLGSTNLWPESELADLQEQVARLNADAGIKQFWPNTRDPEVQALLNDPTFMPFETTIERVVDEDNSYYVWDKVDTDGRPLPDAKLDRQASVLAYKDEVVPVRPAEVQIRFKRAHEIVARRRAGLEEGDPLQYDGHGNYVSTDDPSR